MSKSSHNPPPSETTALLADSGPPVKQGSVLLNQWAGFSPETYIIPVATMTRLAATIPLTTLVELVRQAVCRLWDMPHSNPASPGDSRISSSCDAPEIARYFSIAIIIMGAMEGILSTAECGILSYVSSHYGRKPAFLFVLITGIMGGCLIPASEYMPGWLANWVFLSGIVFLLASNPTPYFYLINTYIVDVCVPEHRTASLSKITGWAMLGTCIASALGGSITTKTGNSLIVFYMAAAIYAITFIYIVLLLPESFPEEKRKELSRAHLGPGASVDGSPKPARVTSVLLMFEPLKMFIPTRQLDGTRNWRLTWCGVHTFLFMTGNAYISTGWIVFATSRYHLTPEKTGLFLTIATVSSTIVSGLVVPLLVRFLRPYYSRPVTSSPLSGMNTNRISSQELESGTSDHLDVHLSILSCIIEGISYLSAAAFPENGALIFSAICIGFGNSHTPTIRSLVVGSVDPLKQGEALAAIEMVNCVAAFLSPIIIGGILTATINTVPLLVFYVHLAVAFVSGALLFLVRDVDRYQKPREVQHASDH